ncbi:regulator of sigma factor domain protein [Mycobacterium xenopi 4042]|uniref:Regulator of sigma factor domain protein n=1 Tax=Mycobacterium xenopi 4042 TaxID=1299334 RepID=X8DLY3_MYCXE|nr:regulator of sigma factor domain protein [Mycobacterium xenopi 4042]
MTYTVAEFADLSPARQQGSRYGRLLGLSADGIADLQLIITELATNSLQHGNGKCWLAFWEHDGHLVCEARDTGFLDDPLAGRRPPSGEETSPAGCSSSTPWPTSCASTQRRGYDHPGVSAAGPGRRGWPVTRRHGVVIPCWFTARRASMPIR